MRTPVEIWIIEHRKVIEHADRLVDLLAPDDIQSQIANPDNKILRTEIADHLDAFIEISEKHYRDEENLLIPAIIKHIGSENLEIKHALGCFAREHGQMHEFVVRIRELLPALRSEDKIESSITAEILRTSYASQSLIRNHSAMEEKEVYPLVGKLPMKVVAEIFEKIGGGQDMNLEHLIRPLYGKSVKEGDTAEGEKKFKFGADGMDFYSEG